jgi:hypothetical protein
MEPRIQYAGTEDGVSIAFWTLGEGMPYGHPSRSLILLRYRVGPRCHVRSGLESDRKEGATEAGGMTMADDE